MSKFDINFIKKSYLNDDSFEANHLHFIIKGKDVNHVIVNTLRRILLDEVPNLSFIKENIDIIKNTSVYNNDYMKSRIENLPILNVKYKSKLEDLLKYRKSIRTKKYIENEENEENESILTMYCNYKNDSDNYYDVTSEDVEFYYNDKKIDTIYKNPILIVRLKPNEEIEFSARTKEDIGLNNSIFSNVGICCYEIINDNEFLFKMEPRSFRNSYELLELACEIIIFRLKELLDKISNKKFSNDNRGKIMLNNEDHTFGNLLTKGLQENKYIELAGYTLEHLLIRDITIDYICHDNIKNVLENVLENYIKLFSFLKTIIKK